MQPEEVTRAASVVQMAVPVKAPRVTRAAAAVPVLAARQEAHKPLQAVPERMQRMFRGFLLPAPPRILYLPPQFHHLPQLLPPMAPA